MTMQNNDLTTLPNIGKVLADKLKVVGIDTIEKLKSIGSKNAFIKLKTIDSEACINSLYALEGAIKQTRWHDLDKCRKEELKMFFEITKRIAKK